MISLNYFFADFTFCQDQRQKFYFYFFQIEWVFGDLDELECVWTWTGVHLKEFGTLWSRLAKIEKGQTSTYSAFLLSILLPG